MLFGEKMQQNTLEGNQNTKLNSKKKNKVVEQ